MKVGVFCEESQAVTIAFRKLGHEAYSYDLQDCSGGHPEWHIKCDIRDLLDEYFDLLIYHPTCRYLANSGVRHLYTESGRWKKLKEGCAFFNLRHRFNAPRVATENPIPHRYAVKGYHPGSEEEKWDGIGSCDQVIQPWQFGHKKMKATCFWLKNLPVLKPTHIVGPPPKDKKERYWWQDVWREAPGPNREKNRSKTYAGIAEAMAVQWGTIQVDNVKHLKSIQTILF